MKGGCRALIRITDLCSYIYFPLKFEKFRIYEKKISIFPVIVRFRKNEIILKDILYLIFTEKKSLFDMAQFSLHNFNYSRY